MSAVMFDTDFVSHVVGPPPPQTDRVHYDEWLAVQQVAKTAAASGDILLSAAVWFELQAVAFDDGNTLADRISAAMQVVIEEINAPVVDLAGRILRARRKLPKFCSRCLAVDADKPCTRCGRMGSRLNKTTDALIVAHAESIPRVTTLYTLDGGPIELAKFLKSSHLKVMNPPNPHGALWAPGAPPTAPSPAMGSAPTTEIVPRTVPVLPASPMTKPKK